MSEKEKEFRILKAFVPTTFFRSFPYGNASWQPVVWMQCSTVCQQSWHWGMVGWSWIFPLSLPCEQWTKNNCQEVSCTWGLHCNRVSFPA